MSFCYMRFINTHKRCDADQWTLFHPLFHLHFASSSCFLLCHWTCPVTMMTIASLCNSMAVTCVQGLRRLPFILLYLNIGADLHSNQTILQQRFTMRCYNLEHNGRLTNLAKAIEWVPWAEWSVLRPIKPPPLDIPSTMLLIALHLLSTPLIW